jgi:hypothetical protein
MSRKVLEQESMDEYITAAGTPQQDETGGLIEQTHETERH